MNTMSYTGRGQDRGGFTLVEMLVAVAITLVFGAMAAATLMNASGMWRAGHRRSWAFDAATVVFQQIEDDLDAAKSQFWGPQQGAVDTRVKFWLDRAQFDYTDTGGTVRTNQRQRLRFVRGIPDAAVNPRLRQAGDGADNDGDGPSEEEWYNLQDDDGDDLVDEDLRALGGTMEAAYVLGLGDDGSGEVTDPTTLYRAVLAPIGEDTGDPDDPQNTFFYRSDSRYYQTAGANQDSLGTSSRIDAKAVPLGENVLHFEVRAWTQYTTRWETEDENGNPVPFQKWTSSYQPTDCRPTLNWDSDRLVGAPLPQPPPYVSPEFVMDPDGGDFPPNGLDADNDGVRNDQDPDYVTDNVFPAKILVVLTVEPPEELRGANPMALTNGVNDSQTTLDVRGTAPPIDQAWPFVRIGNEWMEVEEFNLDDGEILIAERGVRGTAAAAHDAGDRVRIGYTFSRVFRNPAGREDW